MYDSKLICLHCYLTIIVSSIAIYCSHTVKWFQVLLFNTNNSIWRRDGILANTTTPGQCGTGSNGNEEYSTFSSLPIGGFSVISGTVVAVYGLPLDLESKEERLDKKEEMEGGKKEEMEGGKKEEMEGEKKKFKKLRDKKGKWS